MITGNRIDLRCLEEGDLPLVAHWRNQPDVRKLFFDKSLIPLSGQRLWYDRYLQDRSRRIFIAASRDDASPVGMIGLYRIDERDRHAEIGSTVVGDRSLWGQGIGTEMIGLLLGHALADLGLHRIYAYAVHYNQASLKAKLKCGFRQEGLLREAHFADGSFHDVVLFGITRGDWESHRATAVRP